MAQKPQRIIEVAVIDRVGPITAERLMAMSEAAWGLLRQRITDARRERDHRSIAACLRCGGAVFIKARAFRQKRLPYFAHFKGADAACPWFTGDTQDPDSLKAGQYHGHQESPAHRLICEQIAQLAEQDPSCTLVAVDTYLAPTAGGHGRYPDVLVTYADGRKVAFEIQLSNTFQTEIADRSLHYRREGVGLIWVLLGHELQSGDLPQSFRDVILRHRDNAFVLDQAAIEASLAARRLMLTCFLRKSDGSFGDERQVAVNDLTFPETGWPYYEDRVTPSLLARGEAVRAPWKVALQARTDFSYSELTTPAFIAANSDLCARVPGLALWQHQNLDRWQFAHFIAVMFSTLRYAAGAFKNYASRQPNIQAMLNSKLSGHPLMPFAPVLQTVLARTSAGPLLEGTVGVHLRRALELGEGNLVLEAHAIWPAIHTLLPEIFDGALRLQLETLGALPAWAKSSTDHLAYSYE